MKWEYVSIALVHSSLMKSSVALDLRFCMYSSSSDVVVVAIFSSVFVCVWF